MTNDLIDAVAKLPKVMPHIEVPVQAGDDEILQAMRRGYTNQDYRDLSLASVTESLKFRLELILLLDSPGKAKQLLIRLTSF